MKWEVFCEAPNQIVAEGWRSFLVAQGVPCRLYPGDVSTFMGLAQTEVRLMTTEDRLQQALELIDELLDDEDDETA